MLGFVNRQIYACQSDLSDNFALAVFLRGRSRPSQNFRGSDKLDLSSPLICELDLSVFGFWLVSGTSPRSRLVMWVSLRIFQPICDGLSGKESGDFK